MHLCEGHCEKGKVTTLATCKAWLSSTPCKVRHGWKTYVHKIHYSITTGGINLLNKRFTPDQYPPCIQIKQIKTWWSWVYFILKLRRYGVKAYYLLSTRKNIASINAFYVVYFNYCDGINFKFPEIIMSVISVGVGTTSIIQGHYGNVTAFWRLKSPATRPLVHASNKENIEVPYLRPFARPPPVTNDTDIFPNKFYWKFIFILIFRFYSSFSECVSISNGMICHQIGPTS